MKIIKKDFVNEDTKSYCLEGRRLTSGTAYYLQASDGSIYYGGKRCAEKIGINDIKEVPDLTKGLTALQIGSSSEANKKNINHNGKNNIKSIAISYLLLRQESLADYKIYRGAKETISESHDKLQEYYQSYQQAGDLLREEIDHIINIEKYSKDRINKKLSFINLSTCNAYHFVLKKIYAALKNENNHKGINYVSSLQAGLKDYCHLQPAQIDGLQKWLVYLPKDIRNAKLRKF